MTARLCQVVAVVATIAASVGLFYVTTASRSAPVPLGARFPQIKSATEKFRVFVFVDAADCRGNLAFLSVFQRDTAMFQLENLLLLGARDSLSTMQDELESQSIRTPLLAASRPQSDAARLLGSRGTPFIVIIDPDNVVRLAMYSPPDVEKHARFHELMRGLVDQGLTDPLLSRP